MMKYALALVFVVIISGCASPVFNMTDEQIRTMSDDQLCSYKNAYRAEARTEAEVARRGLNCNRYYRECIRRGNQPGTQAMNFCMDLVRENERLRYQENMNVFGHGGYGSSHRTGVGIGLGF